MYFSSDILSCIDRGASFPTFGLLAGCDFVEKPCINATTGQVVDGATNEFCTAPVLLDGTGVPLTSSLNSVFCDPSYQSWTICDLSNVRSGSSDELRYFADTSLTTVAFTRADNCPIPNLQLGLKCSDENISSYNVFYNGESVGTGSRCINAYNNDDSTGRAYQPACINVTCDTDSGVVRLGDASSTYVCTYDGQELPLENRSDGATFICPRLAAVCPELFTCPDGCFGRGECVYSSDSGRPTCRCFDNNTHASCAPAAIVQRSTTAPNTPAPVELVSGGDGGVTPSAPVVAPVAAPGAAPRRAPVAPQIAPTGTAPSSGAAARWKSSLCICLIGVGWYWM